MERYYSIVVIQSVYMYMYIYTVAYLAINIGVAEISVKHTDYSIIYLRKSTYPVKNYCMQSAGSHVL